MGLSICCLQLSHIWWNYRELWGNCGELWGYMSSRRNAFRQHPTEDTLCNQVHYKPQRPGKSKHKPKRVGPSPEARAHTLLGKALTMDTSEPKDVGMYLFPVLRALPTCITGEQQLRFGALYTMRGAAHTHWISTMTWQDLAAHVRAHYHLTMGVRRLGQSLQRVLAAWRATMLSLRC